VNAGVLYARSQTLRPRKGKGVLPEKQRDCVAKPSQLTMQNRACDAETEIPTEFKIRT
jgi:hypothetical protein